MLHRERTTPKERNIFQNSSQNCSIEGQNCSSVYKVFEKRTDGQRKNQS
jgi:hypothetical protein